MNGVLFLKKVQLPYSFKVYGYPFYIEKGGAKTYIEPKVLTFVATVTIDENRNMSYKMNENLSGPDRWLKKVKENMERIERNVNLYPDFFLGFPNMDPKVPKDSDYFIPWLELYSKRTIDRA